MEGGGGGGGGLRGGANVLLRDKIASKLLHGIISYADSGTESVPMTPTD